VIAGFPVIYAIGASEISSAEAVCPAHINCSHQDAVSKGNNGRDLEQTVSPIVAGTGGAVLIAGLLWHFLEHASAPSASAAKLTPVLIPGYAGAGVSGSF
jgi:hypothetical protein